jgi:hypothetical protein
MHYSLRYGLCFTAVAAMSLLAVSIRNYGVGPAAESRPIYDWDITELAVHLNRKGVEVQVWTVPKNGPLNHSAYLTSTVKEWHDLNALNKDPRRIQEWRGTLYCERIGESEASHLLKQWDYRCLIVGPFLLYGDAELLKRVRMALGQTQAAFCVSGSWGSAW